MPSLLLRGLDAATIAQVRALARAAGVRTPDMATTLLTEALTTRQQRAKGAALTNAALTPEQRSARARAAVTARWARHRAVAATECAATRRQ